MPTNQVFDVDVAGMRKVAMRRGAAWILLELIQNSIDEAGVTQVDVTLEPIAGRPLARLRVADDSPDGFKDLKHAFTLYAESPKRENPEQRGFLDIGEKFVIAACERATITTTTGIVHFEGGKRFVGRVKTPDRGTIFEGLVRLTRAQIDECLSVARTIISPKGITITINGAPLAERQPVASFEASLQTTIPDEEGVMRRAMRKTTVDLYEPLLGETSTLYELGLPVVEVGDTYHYQVNQRIPVTSERDNVPPGFLKALRVAALNATAIKLDRDEASKTWVREAAGDSRVAPQTVEIVLTKRFGEKHVIADPSDREATHRAAAEGYTVIHGGSLTPQEWEQVKRVEAAAPAGQLFPTPGLHDDGVGPPRRVVPEHVYTLAQRDVVAYCERLGSLLLGHQPPWLRVEIVNEPIRMNHVAAEYGGGRLTLNLGRLGHAWFDRAAQGYVEAQDALLELLLHELAHDFPGGDDHLSSKYHEALCTLGARLARLALEQPFDVKNLGRDRV